MSNSFVTPCTIAYPFSKGSSQTVKNLPATQETWVWSPGWEDPLKEGTANHSSILDWRIPWTGEPGRLQSTGSQRVRHNWATSMHAHTIACQASLWMEVSWQKYSSGLPFPPPGDLPNPGIEPFIGRWILYHWATRESLSLICCILITRYWRK